MRRIAIALTTLMLIAATASLGAVVRVEPRNAAVYVGEPFAFQVALINADVQEAPDPPSLSIDGATVEFRGVSTQSSQSLVVENGRRVEKTTRMFIYQYEVTAQRTGQFEAPAVEFEIGGETLASRPTTFSATEAPRYEGLRIEVRANEDSVYVGQPVRVTWQLLLQDAVESVNIDWPTPEGFDVYEAPQNRPRQRDDAMIPLMGEMTLARRGQRMSGGVVWRAYTAEKILIPREAGTLEIPPSKMFAEVVVTSRGGRSFFDRQTSRRKVSAASEPVTIEVLPLPEEGRPDDFNGLVGVYTVDAEASPRRVNVGDPIDLTVTVRGPEPLASVPDLNLGGNDRITSRFRVGSDGSPPERDDGELIIRRELRARSADVERIPPIELPYFDAETGRYATARSAPIELEVNPTKQVTLADAEGLDGAPEGGAIESRAGGLAANATGPEALRSDRFDLGEMLTAPTVIAGVAAPPLLCAAAGVLAVARRRRERDPSRAVRRSALVRRIAQLEGADADQTAAAVRGYFADRFGASPSLTGAEAADLLPPDAHGLREQVRSLLDRCDAARFGGLSESDEGELAQRAAELLARVDAEGGER